MEQSEPKTRRESKKGGKEKARGASIYTGKHIRQMEVKQATSARCHQSFTV